VTTLLLLLAQSALARPDDGTGLYVYDSADTLAWVDSARGRVRVHYSVSGPNVTLLDDDDRSGAPDFAEDVAATAEDVLAFYEAMGFRTPLTETEVGLDPLGGSDAFDFYLIDFGGSADGLFSADGCTDGGARCAGHMLIENDFAGYGYGSLDVAISVLASHELFHAVQSAYLHSQPTWLSEGTAVWAEHQYLPGVDDFYWFCSEYLNDPGRSIYSPPAGAVSSFSYGTALFFQFLTERLGDGVGPAIQEALYESSKDEAFEGVIEAMELHGGELADEWPVFARWNLATGLRAGAMESYPFADELDGVMAEVEGESIQDDNRFYPIAATYFHLEHPGGPLRFAALDDPTGLVFSLHASENGRKYGAVEAALATWSDEWTRDLGELEDGSYWLVGTYPQVADQSVKVEFCLGAPEATAACEKETGGDTGVNTGLDTGQVEAPPGDADTGGTVGADTGGDTTKDPDEDSAEEGCGCASASSGAGGLALLGLLGFVGVRRRTPPPSP